MPQIELKGFVADLHDNKLRRRNNKNLNQKEIL